MMIKLGQITFSCLWKYFNLETQCKLLFLEGRKLKSEHMVIHAKTRR